MLASLVCGMAVVGLAARRRWRSRFRPPAILQELNSFREMGSVLYIAAHPDDENTLLIAYLARGRNYRTAYLSLTRGDGGQNVLGPEFGEELGVARTQELLAARRLDGGRQFFTRAIDFGFSKDYRETLQHLGQAGSVVRYRARHPQVSAGRDHHPVFHRAGRHARASHRVGGAGASKRSNSRATPRRFLNSNWLAVAAQAHFL